MAASKADVTLQEAAELLGVHYMTAYRYVRLGLLPARKEGGAWRVAVADVKAMRSSDAVRGRGRARAAPWPERLTSRLLAGDEPGAWAVVEGALASGADAGTVYLDVLAPAMAQIGEKWEAGEIDVAVEHWASVIAMRTVGRLGPRFRRRGRARGSVVLGCAPGERHSLPVAILSDLVRGSGFEVVDLGADVPQASWVAAVGRADGLVAVGVSVTTPGYDEVVRAALEAIKAVAPPPAAVLLGGRAIDGHDRARALGADGWAADGRGTVDLLEGLVQRGTESV